MAPGGMTQFLTAAQGMPEEIEEFLDKRIKTFMWEGRSVAPINNDILFLPIEQGGKNLLCIKDHNNAIKLKDLGDFLTKDEDRAKWCYLADKGFQKEVPQGIIVDKKARINPFIQTWAPLQKKLPRPLKRMYRTATKFGLTFDALALEKNVKDEIPVWFHPGGKKDLARHNNSSRAKCLRDNHGVKTV
ncbi:hypothetical protein B0H16DRAFT_1337550, partial [Mycena metata]